MMTSNARIETTKASQYLQQLCKHFAHKRPVEFDPAKGRIEFDFGTCSLEAPSGALLLRAASETAEDLAHLEDVIARHLQRFAFREELAVDWSPAD